MMALVAVGDSQGVAGLCNASGAVDHGGGDGQGQCRMVKWLAIAADRFKGQGRVW